MVYLMMKVLRHNLYLPGTGIKVISPKKLKKISPDIIIIFAWRYYKLILPKIKSQNGVKIIIPLPQMKKFNEKNIDCWSFKRNRKNFNNSLAKKNFIYATFFKKI